MKDANKWRIFIKVKCYYYLKKVSMFEKWNQFILRDGYHFRAFIHSLIHPTTNINQLYVGHVQDTKHKKKFKPRKFKVH